MSSPAARRAAAKRQRTWRARRRDGAAVYPVPADALALNFLIDLGWLGESESGDRREVGRAIAALLEDAARRHKIP
jgi:hypothetical protein